MDVIKHGEASTSVDGVLTIVNGSHALTFGIESYSDADAESLSQNDNVVGFIESNDPDLISVMVLV